VFGDRSEEALRIMYKRQLQGGFCLEGLTVSTPSSGQMICKVGLFLDFAQVLSDVGGRAP